MSTSPILVPISLVYKFLAKEKIASRHWLQCQMECLLDQVFDQLSTKFEDYLASNAITITAHHTTIDSDHIQHQPIHEPPFQVHSHAQFPQFQATTDHLINTEFPIAVGQSQNGRFRGNNQVNPDEMDSSISHENHDHQTIYDQSQYPPSLSVPTSNQELSNQNDANEEYGLGVGDDDDQLQNDDNDDDIAHLDSEEQEQDRTKFTDTNNQLITATEQMSQSNASLFAPASNEQSNHNLANGDDEDGLCDCDECLYGIEVEEEEDGDDDDDDDDVQFIENTDGPSRLAKIPRIDTTESNNRQSLIPSQSSILDQTDQSDNEQSTEPTEEAEADNVQTNEEELSLTKKNQRIDTTQQSLVSRHTSRPVSSDPTDQVQANIEPNGETDETNNQDKQMFITIKLQCHHTGCPQMFNHKSELNRHMATQHDILEFRCVVKDCKQSFSNTENLSEHLKQSHPSTSQWHCDKCAKQFSTYRLLSTHSMRYHQLGQFNCTYPDCSFTGAYKQNVYDHYAFLHKVETTCHHRDCGRRFKRAGDLRRHQQAHLGIRPYRCKWPSCGFAATICGNTITHIKRMHLTQHSQTTEQQQQPQVDPREYLEVLPDLL